MLFKDARVQESPQEAAKKATRKVPIKYLVVGLQGEILQEEWV